MNRSPTTHQTIEVRTSSQGLFEITADIKAIIERFQIDTGLCHLYIQHTSCSLIIQENADPSARRDLESWMNRLVKENDSLYTHIAEGADDMPSHIKSILTQTSLSIPIINCSLALGTWQGIYLWEHRHHPHLRKIIVSTVGAS